MPIETVPYDVAAHLTNPNDQAELIADAVASGDAAIADSRRTALTRHRAEARRASTCGASSRTWRDRWIGCGATASASRPRDPAR